MFSGYPRAFLDSVMKPSTRNRPSSDTIYQGTVTIPYVKGTSKKFRRIGNRFNFRTIFKTKQTLRGRLTKTGPVRDAQQTKQCVYSIQCDCGRCYIGETSRLLQVRIKEHNQWVPGVTRPGREADHSPPASAEVKQMWIYTSTLPYAFMA
jgi:hypothetical protein